MKNFLVLYEYVANMVERRAPFREAHLAHSRAARQRGDIVFGAPYADPVDGAVLIFQFEDVSGAENFVKADPYFQNGLIARYSVRELAKPASAP